MYYTLFSIHPWLWIDYFFFHLGYLTNKIQKKKLNIVKLFSNPTCYISAYDRSYALSGKNCQLLTDEPVEFEKNKWLKLETSEEFLITSEESVKYTFEWMKQNQEMSTCNRLHLESLGPWLTLYAHKLPGHWSNVDSGTGWQESGGDWPGGGPGLPLCQPWNGEE